MGRGKAADEETVRGACAWACMRRDPGYRAAWAAQAGPVRFEAAPFPLRVQTRADLAAADWGLAVWEDPDVEAWRTPFLPGMPVLVAEPDPDPWPDPTTLLGLLGEAGARLEGLRLLNGRFVLKVELGDAALQILVPSGRAFGPGDGIAANLGLSLPLEAPVGRIVDLWRVSGRPPPPRTGRVRDGKIARWYRCWTGSGRRSRRAGWPSASGARQGSPRSGVPTAGCARRSGAGSRRRRRLQTAAGATSCPARCRSRGGTRRPWGRACSGRPPGRSREIALRPLLPGATVAGAAMRRIGNAPAIRRLWWTCGVGSLIQSACALKTDKDSPYSSHCNYWENSTFWQNTTT